MSLTFCAQFELFFVIRKFKTKKWWCQSFLAGVDTILCGFRDDNGIVEELKLISVSELPKKAKVSIHI